MATQTMVQMELKEHLTSPPRTPVCLDYYDLRRRSSKVFWLLMLAGHVSFVFWFMIGTSLSSVSLTDSLAPRQVKSLEVTEQATTTQVYIDVWFALTLGAAVDALMVVATFNTTLIRRFHYAVSQRIMLLASILSCLGIAAKSESCSRTQYLVMASAAACAVYAVFNHVLDRLEKVRYPFTAALAWATPSTYIERFGRGQSSWSLALLHATVVTAFGLCLTFFMRSPWSSFAPTALIVFEWVYLSSLRTKRTPRYLLFGSPPFHASICVHWGIAPIASSPTLSISPAFFVMLLILSRVLLDAHLKTILKSRRDFSWARANVLVSTRKLLAICAALYALESSGLLVLTYIKPIVVLFFFGVANGGFLWVACYHVAMESEGEVSEDH